MSRVRLWTGTCVMLSLSACTLPHSSGMPDPGTSERAGATPAQWLAEVQRQADLMDTTPDAAQRTQALAAATAGAQQCLSHAPNDARCLYAQAQVQGLTARERPLQAPGLLKDMLANLAKAEAAEPALDHAGPARLSAVVLMRAPPWPLGPGDAESAVIAARRAVKRDAGYPPNLITLAEAQSKTDGAKATRAAYAEAQKAVQAWQGENESASADRAKWQIEIDQGLRALQ